MRGDTWPEYSVGSRKRRLGTAKNCQKRELSGNNAERQPTFSAREKGERGPLHKKYGAGIRNKAVRWAGKEWGTECGRKKERSGIDRGRAVPLKL